MLYEHFERSAGRLENIKEAYYKQYKEIDQDNKYNKNYIEEVKTKLQEEFDKKFKDSINEFNFGLIEEVKRIKSKYILELSLSYSQDFTNICDMLDKIEFTDIDLYNLTKKYNDNYIFMKQVYNYMEKKKINLSVYGKTFESFLKQNKILNFLDSVKPLSLDNFNFKLDSFYIWTPQGIILKSMYNKSEEEAYSE